ncbi:MAG: glycosyltransferase family 39 protein [Acidobacteria bacterium]|nr:glycosyltransferase family 39 protein [Acidobacteriota bacterium]
MQRSNEKRLAAQAEPITTAGLRPELFAEPGTLRLNRTATIIALAFMVFAGFGLRVAGLGAEALSEDELNKLEAVADYRANGLTAANGEHPFLMKALQALSIIAAEKWNQSSAVAASPNSLSISAEASLRFPSVIFGVLTVIVLYLFTAELFGREVALIAAALWAFDPSAIGFNRIAKEDTFVLFFFLLANVFWLRSQRVAESGKGKPEPLYWATAASFGAMLASKYVPYLMTVSVSYYYIFQGIPTVRWRLGKRRFLIFILVIGAVFLLLNPTILLPDTWRRMLDFASYKRIGHDGYEFMGRVYNHKLMDWLYGVPWYFYFVFMWVKLPVATICAFLTGLPLMFRRRAGDGRFFLFFLIMIGFIPFMLFGGKFTRYFAPALAVVLIIAGYGLKHAAHFLARRLLKLEGSARAYACGALYALVIFASAWASVGAAPHYRLYTNWLGGGEARAGSYFPQDEFYDAPIRDIVEEISRSAEPDASVATETVGLATYYAAQAGRKDLRFVSLSDAGALKELRAGDLIIAQRGRRYFSNEALIMRLGQSVQPAFRIKVGDIPAADVYVLDETSLAIVASHASTQK